MNPELEQALADCPASVRSYVDRLRADHEELRAGMIEHAKESARQLDDLLKTRSQLERLRRGGG